MPLFPHESPEIPDVSFGFPDIRPRFDEPPYKFPRGFDVMPLINADRDQAEPEIVWRIAPLAAPVGHTALNGASLPQERLARIAGFHELVNSLETAAVDEAGEVPTPVLESVLKGLRREVAQQDIRHAPTELPDVDPLTGLDVTGELSIQHLIRAVDIVVGERLDNIPVSGSPFGAFTETGAQEIIRQAYTRAS